MPPNSFNQVYFVAKNCVASEQKAMVGTKREKTFRKMVAVSGDVRLLTYNVASITTTILCITRDELLETQRLQKRRVRRQVSGALDGCHGGNRPTTITSTLVFDLRPSMEHKIEIVNRQEAIKYETLTKETKHSIY